MSGRWEDVERLLDAALELGPVERSRLLDRECAGDPALRAEVERLLRSCDQAGDFLAQPAPQLIASLGDPPAPGAVLPEGVRLGPYEIVREIGAGGMATVYLAHDLKHERQVALKVFHPYLAASLGTEAFLREIRIAAQLSHPHILPLLDSGEIAIEGHSPVLYYAMPYVDGESLRQRLRREGRLPIAEALGLAREVADALAYAHDQGVVHRDIKPDNILVSESPPRHGGTGLPTPPGQTRASHARVADFGIAKALSRAAGVDTLTRAGITPGTPAYMSPEQSSGTVEIDGRSDVYSLGCVLHEMLTGRVPIGPGAARVGPRSGLPPTVARVVLKALAPDPADRYATAAEFAQALADAATRRPRRRAVTLAVAVLLLAFAGYVWLPPPPSPPATAAAIVPGPSIAILPFTNLSPEPETEYLSDGITEELIRAMTRLEGLQVAARTSAFAFKGRNVDAREVARRLGVATVLEGSVQKSGGRLRVTARLIDAGSGNRVIWSEKYDRELSDVFAVEDEIGREIAEALRLELGAVPGTPTRSRPRDLQAYTLYLKGRHFWNRRTGEGLRQAIAYFEQAAARDPEYALAYSGLADALVLLPEYSDAPALEVYPRAKRAALRALELDSTLAEAHASLAYVSVALDRDWEAAEAGFRRAIALNPGYATAHQWYADYLSARGRFGDARTEFRRAVALDPLSPIVVVDAAGLLYAERRYPEAIAELEKTLELDATFPLTRVFLGLAHLRSGNHERAIAELETAVNLTNRNSGELAHLAHAYAEAGRREEVVQLADELERRSRREAVAPFALAIAAMSIGDHDRAFAWLERAFEIRDPALTFHSFEPLFDPLRRDPRFGALQRKMGLGTPRA